jgi:hypothetical protein
MILVGTAPRGGEDIMRLEKPTLARHLADPTLKGYAVLQKIFFTPTSSSQAAGGAFIERLAQRKEDVDPASGPDVAAAQIAAFRSRTPIGWRRTFRTPYFSRTRTPDTVPSSNFTTRLRATRRHFSRRTHRSHPTESPRDKPRVRGSRLQPKGQPAHCRNSEGGTI